MMVILVILWGSLRLALGPVCGTGVADDPGAGDGHDRRPVPVRDRTTAPVHDGTAALMHGGGDGAEASGETCTSCHTCDNPTGESPCLRACPRPAAPPAAFGTEGPAASARPAPPDRVMLDDLEDLYEPVPFDHKGHADMAEMTSGCAVCHHYTPRGREHPACRSCHQATTTREDIGMPGLKGAYHRQCLSCHREWSHDTACNACHVSASPRGASAGLASPPSSADVIARMSPPIERLATYVYDTDRAPSPLVTFHHADHAESFGLRCVECHRGDSCSRCHDGTLARTETATNGQAPHSKNTCFTCHNETHCEFCHDQVRRPSFDHATHAGWSLEPHHAAVPCGDCHGPVKDFTIPSRTCHACHVRQHGEGADQPMLAATTGTDPNDAACLSCHEGLKDRFDHATCIHGPATGGTGCETCHQPSLALSPRPDRDRQRELCLGCHDRPIDSGRGRPLADIAALLAENPNHHGPVREGHCSACHDPHASDHARLLVGEYAPGFYVSFDLSEYELCFGCHDEKRVLNESGTALTGFRDGDLNLHWLHVNRDKGRTCRACHEIHASSRPFHIRDSVPFGDSGWMLPINYTRTTDGGGCAPGCHAAKSYRRIDAAPASSPTEAASRPRVFSELSQ